MLLLGKLYVPPPLGEFLLCVTFPSIQLCMATVAHIDIGTFTWGN